MFLLSGGVTPATVTRIHNALVISLAHDAAKWEATRLTLRGLGLGLNVQRVPGVEADSFKLHTLLLDGRLTPEAYNDIIEHDTEVTGVRLTQGSMGCLLAHVAAWELVVAGGEPVVIFEDDAVLGPDFAETLLHALDEVPNGAFRDVEWDSAMLTLRG